MAQPNSNANQPAPPQRTKSSIERVRALYPEFSRLLITQLNQLLPQQQAARENLDAQIMDAPGDDADLSVLDTSADYFLHMANTQQHEIIETREALERISRRTYGICENCDETISIERLKRVPEARLCIDCQSFAERNLSRLKSNPRPKL